MLLEIYTLRCDNDRKIFSVSVVMWDFLGVYYSINNVCHFLMVKIYDLCVVLKGDLSLVFISELYCEPWGWIFMV